MTSTRTPATASNANRRAALPPADRYLLWLAQALYPTMAIFARPSVLLLAILSGGGAVLLGAGIYWSNTACIVIGAILLLSVVWLIYCALKALVDALRAIGRIRGRRDWESLVKLAMPSLISLPIGTPLAALTLWILRRPGVRAAFDVPADKTTRHVVKKMRLWDWF